MARNFDYMGIGIKSVTIFLLSAGVMALFPTTDKVMISAEALGSIIVGLSVFEVFDSRKYN